MLFVLSRSEAPASDISFSWSGIEDHIVAIGSSLKIFVATENHCHAQMQLDHCTIIRGTYAENDWSTCLTYPHDNSLCDRGANQIWQACVLSSLTLRASYWLRVAKNELQWVYKWVLLVLKLGSLGCTWHKATASCILTQINSLPRMSGSPALVSCLTTLLLGLANTGCLPAFLWASIQSYIKIALRICCTKDCGNPSALRTVL